MIGFIILYIKNHFVSIFLYFIN